MNLLSNIFQCVYFFSIVLMFFAAIDRVKVRGIGATSADLGMVIGAAVAVVTFVTVQFWVAVGAAQLGDYPTCPFSVFVISVGYNLNAYAGVNILKILKQKKGAKLF